ncbi:type VI secretion system tube protein Hcp [Dyadobacter sp. NIV53]|uniref:type VI secretion system tube protein Hcp n=1 Tax=Dyadobacter sp. NIV53 TaxID=2861765 RepID=UPI001C87711A|nr:type VI secretion system tube protein Hcp [Dyadobacter sp. NIV53]
MKKVCLLLFCACYLSFTSRVTGQGLFLKAGELTAGASQNDTYQDYAEIHSFQFGTMIDVNITGGTGSGVGKPSATKVVVTKSVDVSSSKLLQKQLMGQIIPEIEIISTNFNGTIVHKIQLKDVYISDVATSGAACSGGCPASETLSLVYTAIKITTYTMNPNGSVTPDTPVMFNFRTITQTY